MKPCCMLIVHAAQETQWHAPAEGFAPWQCLTAASPAQAAEAQHTEQAESSPSAPSAQQTAEVQAPASGAEQTQLPAGHMSGKPQEQNSRLTGLAADLMSLSLGSHTRFDDADSSAAHHQGQNAARSRCSSAQQQASQGQAEEQLSALQDTARCVSLVLSVAGLMFFVLAFHNLKWLDLQALLHRHTVGSTLPGGMMVSDIAQRIEQATEPASSDAAAASQGTAEDQGQDDADWHPGSVDWNAVGLDKDLIKYWAQVKHCRCP